MMLKNHAAFSASPSVRTAERRWMNSPPPSERRNAHHSTATYEKNVAP
jgi:hypothetical protein